MYTSVQFHIASKCTKVKKIKKISVVINHSSVGCIIPWLLPLKSVGIFHANYCFFFTKRLKQGVYTDQVRQKPVHAKRRCSDDKLSDTW